MATITYSFLRNNVISFDFLNNVPIAPDVVTLANGNVFFAYGGDIAFNGFASQDIEYYRTGSTLPGRPSQGQLNLTTTNNQWDVSLARLSTGQVVAAYSSNDANPTVTRVRFHILNANGTIADTIDHFAIGGPSLDDSAPSVAARQTGGQFIIAMTVNLGHGYVAYFDSSGVSQGAVNSTTLGVGNGLSSSDHILNLSASGLANGNYVVAYEYDDSSGTQGVAFQRLNGASATLVDAAPVIIDAFGVNNDIHVAGLPDGGFVVVYTDTGWDNSSGQDITARVYNADGSARSTYLRVNSTSLFLNDAANTSGNQSEPDVTVFANGDFAVSWTTGGASFDVMTRLFNAQGAALTGINALATTVRNETQSTLAATSGGNFVAAWRDSDATNIGAVAASYTRNTFGDATNENLVGDDFTDNMQGLGGDDFLSGDALSVAGLTFGSGAVARLANTNNGSLA